MAERYAYFIDNVQYIIIIIHIPAQRLGVYQEFLDPIPPCIAILG